MNSAIRQMSNTWPMNNNFFIIIFIIFNLQQNKLYPNGSKNLYSIFVNVIVNVCVT